MGEFALLLQFSRNARTGETTGTYPQILVSGSHEEQQRGGTRRLNAYTALSPGIFSSSGNCTTRNEHLYVACEINVNM